MGTVYMLAYTNLGAEDDLWLTPDSFYLNLADAEKVKTRKNDAIENDWACSMFDGYYYVEAVTFDDACALMLIYHFLDV